MSADVLVAAAGGRTADVVAYLDAGGDIEACDVGTGRTVLLEAVAAGRSEVVQVLCERGADVEAAAGGRTALSWAVGAGIPDAVAVVDILLAHGAEPNRTVHDGGVTTLMHAAETGDEALVRKLVDAGAEIDVCDQAGQTVLSRAVAHAQATQKSTPEAGRRFRMVALLKSLGANMPPPPPEPAPILWPDVPWDTQTPTPQIPSGATPEQVLRGFMLAMHFWEAGAYNPRALTSLESLEGHHAFRGSVAAGTQILRAYVTDRKRTYGGQVAGAGWPPRYSPDFVLLSVEAPTTSRRLMHTRHVNCRWRQRQGRPPQPRSPNGYMWECLYVVLKKHGQWRVDSVKTRVFGTEKWEVGIL